MRLQMREVGVTDGVYGDSSCTDRPPTVGTVIVENWCSAEVAEYYLPLFGSLGFTRCI
jgi:hypothetical protein